jgi:sec-independent protein translocase protein TatB
MFDLAWSELLVIGVVALLVIKPKDLPKVLRTVGYWVRHARQVASEFQSSLEQMAREAELSDVKKEIEDAGRKLTTDIQQTFDPVEIEKKFNPVPETPSAEATPSIAPPIDEPTLPGLEPGPTQHAEPAPAAHSEAAPAAHSEAAPAAHAEPVAATAPPSLEPAAAKPPDRV